LYATTGRDAEARSLYLQALELNTQDAAALRGLAAIARRQQDTDEAIRLMARAIELQPGNWNSINALGNIYFLNGRYREAAAEYRKVVYLDPQNFIALGNLGSTSLMDGDFEMAKQAIERSIDMEPNPTILSNLGIVYYYLGDFDKSVEVHRQVVELTPDLPGSWINLADALHFAGDVDASRQAFKKGAELAGIRLELNRADTESLMFLAWAQAMTGNPEEGVAQATRAVELAPGNPYSHYYHALTLLKNGETERAIDAISRAIERGYSTKMLAAEPYLREVASNPGFRRLIVGADN
jgi:tetratricopeptide (TPR) repeat protein